jgi:hypothetical protein
MTMSDNPTTNHYLAQINENLLRIEKVLTEQRREQELLRSRIEFVALELNRSK